MATFQLVAVWCRQCCLRHTIPTLRHTTIVRFGGARWRSAQTGRDYLSLAIVAVMLCTSRPSTGNVDMDMSLGLRHLYMCTTTPE